MQGASDLNGQSPPFQQISTYFDSGIGRGFDLDGDARNLLDYAKFEHFAQRFTVGMFFFSLM